MNEVPCNGCEERQVGCHAKCKKYLEYRENRIQNHRKSVIMKQEKEQHNDKQN